MKQKYLTVTNVWNRLKAESPTYFKKMIRVCVALAAAGTALIALKEVEQTAKYVNLLVNDKVPGYLILAGVVGAFVSKMTVSNPNENPKVN